MAIVIEPQVLDITSVEPDVLDISSVEPAKVNMESVEPQVLNIESVEPQVLDISNVEPVQINVQSTNENNIAISTSGAANTSIAASTWSNNYDALTNKPRINGNIIKGDKTPEELGIVEDKTYFHNQTIASDTWVIVHNLNKYPAVSIIDSAGNEVTGEVYYNDTNTVTVSFKGGFKGSATLN